MQWGYKSSFNGGAKLSFPISFSNTTYTITGSSWDSLQIYCPKFTNKETTQCTMHNGIGHVSYNGTSALDWVAIGIQQWGELQAQAINTTITLPIAYEINHFAVVTSTTDSTGAGGLYTSNGCDRTLTTFRFACEATGGRLCCWISCGAQQWGFLPSVNKDTTTVFDMPLSVTVVYHFNMQAKVQRASNSYLNGHAFVGHNGNASITIGDSDHGSAKWWFAICKAQQWRNSVSAKATFTYPLAFSVVYIVMLTSTGNNWCWASNITVSSAYNDNKSTSCFMALGAQQWGTFQDGTNWDKYFSFPIAFPTACYASCVTDIYNGDKNEDVYFREKPTTTEFRIRVGAGFSCPHLVIAIGKQQWGEGSYSTYTFPIAFTNTSYVFVSQMNLNFADAHYERNNYVNQKQITYITLGSASLNRFWTAIGY